jgi:putative membrane protein
MQVINIFNRQKKFIMKKHFFNLSFVLAAGFIMLSCNNTSDTEKTNTDTTKTAMSDANTSPNPNGTMSDSNSNKMAPNSNLKTNEFVSKAGAGGMMEVAMGKLAQSNGGSNDVKDYGKMLEKDHGEAGDKLKSIANAEGISFPSTMTDEQSQHMAHLQSLTGADFDKAFIPMMIDDHTKDIAEFKKAAAGNENEKVKNFASTTLPTLEAHLSKAKSIKSKMK